MQKNIYEDIVNILADFLTMKPTPSQKRLIRSIGRSFDKILGIKSKSPDYSAYQYLKTLSK